MNLISCDKLLHFLLIQMGALLSPQLAEPGQDHDIAWAKIILWKVAQYSA